MFPKLVQLTFIQLTIHFIKAMAVAWICEAIHQHRFLRFYFSVFSLVYASIEKIFQTLEAALRHIFTKTSNFVKNTLMRAVSSNSVWKCDETLSY